MTFHSRALATGLAAGTLLALACGGEASGTSGVGGGGGAAACPGALLSCDGVCVDTDLDPKHCGACGTECTLDETCTEGQCALSCSAGKTQCGSVCTDTSSDPENCGACGNVCANACISGACERWTLKGTKSAEVITGSCSDTETKVVECNSTTLGVEGRVVDAFGIELKAPLVEPLIGALLGRTGSVSADGKQLTLTGRTGCGKDTVQTMTVSYYVCE